MTPEQLEQLEVLRRIAERGLSLASTAAFDMSRAPQSRAAHALYIDLWQHLLDELARI